MKRVLRIIASVLVLSLMFVFLACSVWADDGVIVTKTISGGYFDSFTNKEISPEMSINIDRIVNVSTTLKVTLDPQTPQHTVSASVKLRRSTWYGYQVALTQILHDDVLMVNTRTTDYDYFCTYHSSATIPGTGGYRLVGTVSGVSSAFYSQFSGTIKYVD